MKKEKCRILLAYPFHHDDLQSFIGSFKATMSKHCEISEKVGDELTIPDIAAADIICMGSDITIDILKHNEWKEISRALQGINLAGRYGFFFTTREKKILTGLEEMFKDTNLAVPDSFKCVVKNTNNYKEIEKKIIKKCQGRQYD